MGRFFASDEEARPSGAPYVVLGYSLWQKHFASDPAIVGKSIEIAKKPFTVIGVAPRGFIGCMPGIRSDAWLPLSANDDPASNAWIERRDQNWLNVVGRLGPAVSRRRATENLEILMRTLVAEYPNDHPGVNSIILDPLWRSPFGANVFLASTMPFLLAVAGVLLLLTCANIATLALVRFVARRRELAIRQALGASRLELMRQMILEGVFVSLGGGALAIPLTLWTSKRLAGLIPHSSNAIAVNGYVDINVVGAILLLTIAASLICGALPAWKSSHIAAAEALKEESTNVSSGGHNRRLLDGLVIGQIALSFALLVSSGLFMRTLKAVSETDPGFEQSHVLTASVDLGTSGYSRDEVRVFQRSILNKVRGLPGVTNVSITDWVPLSFNRKSVDAYPEGYVPQRHESVEVRLADVSEGYFETLDIPILQGREFTADDNEGSARVAIVDGTAAQRYWPGKSPLGQTIAIYGGRFTVVGVAGNTKHQFLNENHEPLIYRPFFQANATGTIFQVRTRGEPTYQVRPVEKAIHQINAQLPVFDVRPLYETTQVSISFQQIEALFATLLGLLAAVLAATGISTVL